MEETGKELIDSICNQLKIDNKLQTDSDIIIYLRKLDRYQLNQLRTFGDMDRVQKRKLKE